MPDFTSFFSLNEARLDHAGVARPRPNPTFRNPAFDKARFKALIVRLSPFRDVDRSVSHLFLADAVRRAVPGAYVDMCFFPTQRDRPILQQAGVPFLTGNQSCRTLDEFDLVLISNSYTVELINLPYLLLHSGIPLWASERDRNWPPLVLGGSNAMASQAVIRQDGDSMVDAIFFGEGEREVPTLVRAFRSGKAGKSRKLSAAAKAVAGLWLAGTRKPKAVVKAVLDDPDAADLPAAYPLLNSDEAGTMRLQIAYGCEAFCSFCFEGYDRKPYREIRIKDLLRAARQIKKSQGCDTVDLYGFNVAAHSDFPALLIQLSRLFHNVAFKSQRADTLYEAPDLIDMEVAAGKRSFTLGIEGISTRQRARLNKSLPAPAVDGVLRVLFRQRIREIKLFFILVGDEDDADLDDFRETCARIDSLRQRANPGLRVILSFGFLVRMPFTPMRYEPLMLDRKEWEPAWNGVQSACRENGLECRLATPWPEYAVSQVMAMGGHWLCKPLEQMTRDGCCYDARLDTRWWNWLRDWMMKNRQWTRTFLSEKPADYQFALPFVKGRIPASFLHQQYRQLRAAIDTGYCLGHADRPGRCLDCGACADVRQKKSVINHSVSAPATRAGTDSLRALATKKSRLQPVCGVFRIAPRLAGVTPAWLNAFVFQRLLAAAPDQVENLLSVREQLFTVGDNMDRFGILGGETVFALTAWNRNDLVLRLSKLRANKAADVSFLSIAESFTPGVFRLASVTIMLQAESPGLWANRLAVFLREARLPVTIRRDDAAYRLEAQGSAAKRSALRGGTYSESGGVFTARLDFGPKFDLCALLASLDSPPLKTEISGLAL